MKNNNLPFQKKWAKLEMKKQKNASTRVETTQPPPTRRTEEVLHSAAQSENVSWPERKEKKKTRPRLNELRQLQLNVLNFSFWTTSRDRLEQQWRVGKRLHHESFTSTLTAMVLLLRRISAVMMRQKISAWASVRACVCVCVCKTTATQQLKVYPKM